MDDATVEISAMTPEEEAEKALDEAQAVALLTKWVPIGFLLAILLCVSCILLSSGFWVCMQIIKAAM
jgi:hypothetical protein